MSVRAALDALHEGQTMKMQRTSVPGIYLRGTKYVITYRDTDGRQRRESFPTLKEATVAKAKRLAELSEGTYQPESHRTLHDYAAEWLKSYDGIRENTREDYAIGVRVAKEFFSPRVKLTAVTPKAIADYVAFLKSKGLAPASVAKRLAPLRTMFRSALEQGLVRSNPCVGIRLPKREQNPTDDDHEDMDVRVFSRDQLLTILAVTDRLLLFELLASTGLRISEALALEWRHLDLGEKPHVKVRRAIVRGRIGPPKSRYGRRDVALPDTLAEVLREHARGLYGDVEHSQCIVFPSQAGTYLSPNNLRRRSLRSALKAAGCEWAGFHTFRHTFASIHLADGTNLVALSRALGHHSPSFTLSVYGHLLEGDEARPLEFAR